MLLQSFNEIWVLLFHSLVDNMAKNYRSFSSTPWFHFTKEEQFRWKLRNLKRQINLLLIQKDQTPRSAYQFTEPHLCHLMVEGNLLIRWGLISCEDPSNNVSPRGGPADVRQLLEPKSLDDVVEVRSCVYGEASEENRSTFVKQRLEVWFLGFYGENKRRNRGRKGKRRVWSENRGERNVIEVSLLRDFNFLEMVCHCFCATALNL